MKGGPRSPGHSLGDKDYTGFHKCRNFIQQRDSEPRQPCPYQFRAVLSPGPCQVSAAGHRMGFALVCGLVSLHLLRSRFQPVHVVDYHQLLPGPRVTAGRATGAPEGGLTARAGHPGQVRPASARCPTRCDPFCSRRGALPPGSQ